MTAVPRKILIVDDDVHIRRLIALYLRQAGFEVVDSGSGEEALELAAREAFDTVLVDVILPAYGGLRLTQKLKSAAAAPRIIVMSGDESQREAAAGYGADDFLTKPFTRDELLAVVSSRA
ncbi:MAG: two-component system, OmpR family, operon response regulator KdpE [Acidobacteriota bacterium]|jgi:two-component system KDP operon response regulator KdpE|nr:two-component system, OmpR family, operon response regulator KdpE [Acidobacteriota bacterium]